MFRLGISFLLLFLTGCTLSNVSEQELRKPLHPAPSFLLPQMNYDRKEVALSDLKGKVIVLNFFASWCAQCVEEMPILNRVSKALSDDEFVVVGIAIDDEPRALQSYLDRAPVSFPILIDLWERAKIDYEVTSLPTTYIVDKKGMVRLAPEPEGSEWTSPFLGPRQWAMAPFIKYLNELKNED